MGSSQPSSGIVVLGAPRSGTTLLRRLLDAHPAIACPGETFLLKGAARFLSGDTVGDGLDYSVLGGLGATGIEPAVVTSALRDLVSDFLQQVATSEGKRRWASKTAVDSFYIPAIERIFGGHVRFVCVLRHGADVAVSMQDLCDANGVYVEELHPYVRQHPAPLVAFAHAWCDVTRAILDLAAARPNETLVIRYEELVAEPVTVLERLFAFLDEPFDSSLISRTFEEARVQGIGDWKTFTTAGIESSSVGRWQSVPPFAASRLAAALNSTLEAAGYPPMDVGEPTDPQVAIRRYEMALKLEAARAATEPSD